MFITVRVTRIGKNIEAFRVSFTSSLVSFLVKPRRISQSASRRCANKKKKGLMWGEIGGIFKVIQLTGLKRRKASVTYYSQKAIHGWKIRDIMFSVGTYAVWWGSLSIYLTCLLVIQRTKAVKKC